MHTARRHALLMFASCDCVFACAHRAWVVLHACRVILFPNFLDDADCDHITRLAERQDLTRSLTSA